MKTARWTATLFAFTLIGVSGSAFAQIGIGDREDYFRDFKSTKSRADVHADRDAGRADVLSKRGGDAWNTSSWSASRDNIGARGQAGSRYSERTRDDVRDELRNFRTEQQTNTSRDTYYLN